MSEAVSESNRRRWREYRAQKKAITCCIEGCTEEAICRCLCKPHYMSQYAKLRRQTLSQDPEWLEKEKARQRSVQQNKRRKRTEAQTQVEHARVRHYFTGWTVSQTEKALLDQGGCCFICYRTLTDKRGTQRDHYETVDGKRVTSRSTKTAVKTTRALLCGPCNFSLGHYEARAGQREAGLRITQYEDYLLKFGGLEPWAD